MRRRLLEVLSVAAVTLGLVTYLQGSVQGQSPAANAKTAAAGSSKMMSKTAWGHPDLQGIWLDEFETPLERSAQHANKEFFTDAERAAQDEARSGNIGRNKRAPRGSLLDAAGAYNAVFTSVKPTGRRTSMVVEPANGRIPALTPQAAERSRIACTTASRSRLVPARGRDEPPCRCRRR